MKIVNQYLSSPFEIIYPNLSTNKIMVELLKKKGLTNGRIFDVYLIATMLSNEIKYIVTANVKDFREFESISVLDLKTFSSPNP